MTDAALLEIHCILSQVPIDSHVCCNGECAKKIRLADSVTYIVGGILFDAQREKILLIQEAKRSCAGKWYYPAGRVELDETLREAVCREVAEEAGVTLEPRAISHIEVHGNLSWFRFTFVGKYNGALKNIADKESLAARFVHVRDELSVKSSFRHNGLRGDDFMPLVETARRYQSIFSDDATRPELPLAVMPVEADVRALVVRLCIVHYQSDSFSLLLVRCAASSASSEDGWHVPRVAARETDRKLDSLVAQCVRRYFAPDLTPTLRRAGALGVQHSGKRGCDGLVLTLLLHADSSPPLADRNVSVWRSFTPSSNQAGWSKADCDALHCFLSFRDARRLVPINHDNFDTT